VCVLFTLPWFVLCVNDWGPWSADDAFIHLFVQKATKLPPVTIVIGLLAPLSPKYSAS
jgi:hypothetical protein